MNNANPAIDPKARQKIYDDATKVIECCEKAKKIIQDSYDGSGEKAGILGNLGIVVERARAFRDKYS